MTLLPALARTRHALLSTVCTDSRDHHGGPSSCQRAPEPSGSRKEICRGCGCTSWCFRKSWPEDGSCRPCRFALAHGSNQRDDRLVRNNEYIELQRIGHDIPLGSIQNSA